MARIAIIVLSLLLTASQALALNFKGIGDINISDVGNGGDVVVCTRPDGSQTYEILDVWEGRELYGLSNDWPTATDEFVLAQSLLNRLQRVSVYRWKRITDWLNKFKKEAKFGNYDITPIDDSDHPLMGTNCEIFQIARQKKPIVGKLWYHIDKALYDKLDINNKAALILHEVVYREAIQFYKHKNSIASRATTAQLAANHYKDLTDEELFTQLYAFQYPQYEFNNILFEIHDNKSIWEPTWFADGRVESIPCNLTTPGYVSTCQQVKKNNLTSVYGFTSENYEEGLKSFDPLNLMYPIVFGDTNKAKNMAYLNSHIYDYNVGHYQLLIELDNDEAHFLKLSDQGRPGQIKGNITIKDSDGMAFYSVNMPDQWRSKVDAQIFYFGSEVFVGLAGGVLIHENKSISLCGLSSTVPIEKEIGDYPTLIHLGEELDVVRVCAGNAFTEGKLKFTLVGPIDFGKASVDSIASIKVSVENVGDAPVSQILANVSAPFSIKYEPNQCTQELPVNGQCYFHLRFKPNALGNYSSELLVSYNNGSETVSIATEVKGEGGSPALLKISHGSGDFDFGTVPTGSTQTMIFTITNEGESVATKMSGNGLVAPFSFVGGTYPGTGGTCGASLNAGGGCDIEVSYSPVAVSGADSDALVVDYFDGSAFQQATLVLKATAVAPALLTISGSFTYSFGTHAVGSSHSHIFTITNTGTYQASHMNEIGLAAPFGFVGGTYPGTAGNCGATLNGGASCTIDVQYSPTSMGINNDILNMSYFDGGRIQNVTRDVTGTAVAPASLVISETDPFDFGSVAVGGSQKHTFILTNTGGTRAHSVHEIGIAAPFDFLGGVPGLGGTCESTIDPGQSCEIYIKFSPVATGLAADTLVVKYNNGVSAVTTTRDIQGTGVAPALLTISETDPYSFGSVSVGSSSHRFFTITNTGGIAATTLGGSGIAAPFSFSGGAYPGTYGDCGATVESGSSCMVGIAFSPVAPVVSNDTIEINYYDGVRAQTSSRGVTGTGITPAAITISESDPYDFGLIASGGATTQVFTVSNTGGAMATGMAEVGLAAPFAFLGGGYPGTGGTCGLSLSAAGSCTLVIEFTPTATGAFADTIDIFYNDGSSSQNVTRDIQGTGGAPATLTISDGPTLDFGEVEAGTTVSRMVTVTNTGAVNATSINSEGLTTKYYNFVGGSFPGTQGSCGSTLAPGSSCEVNIDFTPKSVNGRYVDQLILSYHDGADPQQSSRSIIGWGIPKSTSPQAVGLSL